MNLVLTRADYPPIVIGPEQRAADIDGLDALVGGDPLAILRRGGPGPMAIEP